MSNRYLYPCLHCKKPMAVAQGQTSYTHRACRAAYRFIRRKQQKRGLVA